ncbi:MAG: nitroreductase family protein [Bacteroidales bacterium]|nr:nitroreductase family protein [Bacteroidales bacterium]MDT8374002.1 nitroreductase family protein [Bacteroidales bacterium]
MNMNLRQLIEKTRTVRRFDESHPVSAETLASLVDLARLSASGANRQPLKYILVTQPDQRELVFPCLAWAGYLANWEGPAQGERPSAYIIILGDKEISDSFGVDHGIASQSIMLGATDAGLGGCIIASVKKERLRNALEIPRDNEILLVLALGKATEEVVLETASDNDIKYWRDEKGIHHVPKRSLDEIILRR